MISPFSEKQARVATWWRAGEYDGVICDGAVRSGKTVSVAASFAVWSTGFTGVSFIVAGQSVQSVMRNVVQPMQRMLEEDFGIPYALNRQAGTLSFGGNTCYIVGAHDERAQDRIQGMTAAGCLLDECALMPRSFIEQAMARCSEPGALWWFNCNPGNPGNFVKTDLIDMAGRKRLLHLHFTMQDNPALSPEYVERVGRAYTGMFHDRYIRGLWVNPEGLVYQCWDEDAMTEGVEVYPGELCYIGMDYGITNPTVCLMGVVRGGRLLVADEWAFDSREEGYRLTDAQIYDRVREWIGGRRVDGWAIDPSASSFMEEVRRRGEFAPVAADNAVMPGIQTVQAGLAGGLVRIDPRCRTLISEMTEYRWDVKASERGEDRVVKEHDHAEDALRYLVRTFGTRYVRGLDW